MNSKVNIVLLSYFLVGMFSCAPTSGTDVSSDLRPAIEASVLEVAGSRVTFSIRSINSVENAVMCLRRKDKAPSAQEVLERGLKINSTKVVVDCDNEESLFTAYFAARDSRGTVSSVYNLKFSISSRPDTLYAWERKRAQGGFEPGPGKTDRYAPYDNLLLLYGGNVWRNPAKWDQERMSAQITYTDKDGKEHWLFDAFLALEIWDRMDDGSHSASLGTGYGADSADKSHWEHFIDYWFEKG